MTFDDDMTIEQARRALELLSGDGHDCPVCSRRVKVYRRPLTSVGARAIAALYQEHGLRFGHMADVARKHLPESASQGGYLVLGQHWGLIEAEPVIRGDVGRTGYWRVTDRGEQWLAGEISVPKYARLLKGVCLALEGDLVTRDDALGQGFDFRALMRDRVPGQPVPLFEAAA